MRNEKIQSRLYSAILSAYDLESHENLAEVMAFVNELSEGGSYQLLGIADKEDPDLKRATFQDSTKGKFKEYVYQYENGGYTGDSYAGYSFLKLGENAYLKFWYEM